jgi:HPr kinase/phosphorylase
MSQVSVRQLFDENCQKLGLVWVAGQQDDTRTLSGLQQSAIGLIGHMNFIHPFKIQVLGPAEISYLNSVKSEILVETVSRLFTQEKELVALIIANNEKVPDILLQASRNNVALLTSPEPSHYVVDVLRWYLAKVLAQSIVLHGVFLDVLGMGVLVTGSSAIGKSELALELISRGHGLIADDAVEFFRISPEILEGRCPSVLRDFLEVRGIGVLNIRTIFGETAVRPKKNLKLIVRLADYSGVSFSELDRLPVNASTQEILGVQIREVLIPVAAGRNLAVLMEAAVRNYILQVRGIDSTKEFIERQQRLLESNNN